MSSTAKVIETKGSIITANGKKHEDSPTMEIQKAPDGGWGWFVVIGATLVHVLLGGVERSSGVVYMALIDRFQGSATATSWIFSIFTTLRTIVGPLVSALSRRFSCRSVAFVGGLLCGVGIIVSGLAPNLGFMYFSFGIVTGIGHSLTYTPSLIMVGTYFNKRRGLAVGISTSGVGLGTFVFTPMVEMMFNSYGYQGTMLLMGGAAFNFCVAALLFRPLIHQSSRFPEKITLLEQNTSNTVNAETAEKYEPDVIPVYFNGSAHSITGDLTLVSVEPETTAAGDVFDNDVKNKEKQFFGNVEPQPTTTHPLTETAESFKSTSSSNSDSSSSANPCAWIYRLFHFGLLKDPTFLALCLSMLLFAIAYNSTYVFLPALANSRGVSKSQSVLLVSCIGILDSAARLVFSVLLDMKRVKRFRIYIYNGVLFLIGTVSVLFPLCYQFEHFIICAILFGLLTGIYKSQKSVIVVDILGVENLSSSFGLILLFEGIGNLIGPVFGGILKDAMGTYSGIFYLGSSGICTGAVVLLIGNMRRYRIQKHKP